LTINNTLNVYNEKVLFLFVTTEKNVHTVNPSVKCYASGLCADFDYYILSPTVLRTHTDTFVIWTCAVRCFVLLCFCFIIDGAYMVNKVEYINKINRNCNHENRFKYGTTVINNTGRL